MVRIFISYAHEDIESAQRLYAELSAIPGVAPWFDKESLLGGMKWEPAIRKAIRETDFFFALLSKNSTSKRGYVNREMKLALEILEEFPEDQIYLIPIRLEDCHPPFEALRGIQYVDFFPAWEDGFLKVLKVINADPQSYPGRESPASEPYEYQCALLDLDAGLTNLPQLCQRLNFIQRYFHFAAPSIPLAHKAGRAIYRYQNLYVESVPKSFYEQRRFINADLVACMTSYPLAFGKGDDIIYNCFSGPNPEDETFMFISTDMLYGFTKRSGRTFEKGIVYVVLSQLIGYFTNLGYHFETKGCIMDYCGHRSDMIKGLKRMSLCDTCLTEIKDRRLKIAVEAILADEMII